MIFIEKKIDYRSSKIRIAFNIGNINLKGSRYRTLIIWAWFLWQREDSLEVELVWVGNKLSENMLGLRFG